MWLPIMLPYTYVYIVYSKTCHDLKQWILLLFTIANALRVLCICQWGDSFVYTDSLRVCPGCHQHDLVWIRPSLVCLCALQNLLNHQIDQTIQQRVATVCACAAIKSVTVHVDRAVRRNDCNIVANCLVLAPRHWSAPSVQVIMPRGVAARGIRLCVCVCVSVCSSCNCLTVTMQRKLTGSIGF